MKEVIFLVSRPVNIHIVKRADTLYKLSKYYDVPLNAIVAANPGVNAYNLLIGQMLTIPAGNAIPPSGTADITSSQIALRNMWRKLWQEHVAWTRMTVIAAIAGSPDLNQTVERLLRNATDMGAALATYYGSDNGQVFSELIREHLALALQLVQAAKTGDAAAAQNIEKQWYANADKVVGFLNSINPYIASAPFKSMFYEHLALTKSEAEAQLAGDYAKSSALYDQIENQALDMADVIADSIIRQFPDQFAA